MEGDVSFDDIENENDISLDALDDTYETYPRTEKLECKWVNSSYDLSFLSSFSMWNNRNILTHILPHRETYRLLFGYLYGVNYF